MDNRDNLTIEDKVVTIYTKGNFIFHGLVDYIAETQVVLEDNEDFVIIYREEIVAIKIHNRKNDSTPLTIPKEEKKQEGRDNKYYNFSGIQLPEKVDLFTDEYLEQANHYGSLIPEDMLIPDPNKKSEPDLSMTFDTKVERKNGSNKKT